MAREAVMRKTVQVLAFLAGAVALTRIGWPGLSSIFAIPVNRTYVIGGLLLLWHPGWCAGVFGPALPGLGAACRAGRRWTRRCSC